MQLSLLHTGSKMNPSNPDHAETEGIGYVMVTAKGAHRIATSYGDLGGDFAIGTDHDVRADQTGRRLGTWKVVGIIDFAKRLTTGFVPTRQVPHLVLK